MNGAGVFATKEELKPLKIGQDKYEKPEALGGGK